MTQSLRGSFLIAHRRLRDPNFYKTVVLIVEHDESGSMGLVVNRPSSVTVAGALAGHFDLPDNGDVVFLGGPVEEQALFILHNSAAVNGAPGVLPGVYVGNSPSDFTDVMSRAEDGSPTVRFRVFSGCSGWGAGQLEGELSRNDWYVLPADETRIFTADPYSLWEECLGQFRQENSLLSSANHANAEWN
jgi:putative transcriptional regulator